MYEELYIIDNGKRLKVDLATPSGITLNFKSNIFGDLSKITCSYTYTFKLPLTANNRRVFDNADDIRADSTKIRVRLKAEYVQNGIPLFSNANLYIESTESCFNAVMTWGVIDGLQTLKDNDIAIHELPNDNTETKFGPFSLNGDESSNPPSRGDSGIADDGQTVHAFDNLALVLGPDYNCGIPHRKWKAKAYTGYRFGGWSTYYGTPPLPVVPVYKLITMINEKFGTKFLLGKHLTSENISELDNKQEVVEVGVIPLVSTNLNDVQLAQRVASLNGIGFVNVNANLSETAGETTTEAKFPDAITFSSISIPNNDYFKAGNFSYSNSNTAGTNRNNVGILPVINGIKVEVDGHLRATFDGYAQGASGGDTPELKIYQRRRSKYRPNVPGYRQPNRSYYEWVELASLTGEQDGKDSSNFYIYDFNFTMEEMNERLECGPLANTSASPLLFAFSTKLRSLTAVVPIKIYLVNSSDGRYKFDVISNLPDISCLEFMKSIYYMIGAFPTTNADGDIVPVFYTDIRDNLLAGNALDWSKKVTTDVSALPSKTSYTSGEYAQHNIYKMKSDKDESKADSSSDKADVYYSGNGELTVENQTLALSKNIIQLPFYAPFNYDKKNPSYDMGQTFKCWNMTKEDGQSVVEWVDPNPCLGLIRDREYYLSTDGGPYVSAGTVMSMIVWNGFTSMESNASYSYLQRIIRKPFVITENLLLNEHDLRHFDFSVPVYLSKYGAYFAIVSITRDSKGICKCELLKLPEEE